MFLPLIIAAGATSLLDDERGDCPPRSRHLAHAAYDLQLYSGDGSARPGFADQIHIEKRYCSMWERPAARMAEIFPAINSIFAAWEGQCRRIFAANSSRTR